MDKIGVGLSASVGAGSAADVAEQLQRLAIGCQVQRAEVVLGGQAPIGSGRQQLSDDSVLAGGGGVDQHGRTAGILVVDVDAGL